MSVASKNLFDLLGGDNDGESEGSPAPKSNARTAAKVDAGKTGGARRGESGNEAVFRDRNIGSSNNRGKPTDDSFRGPPRGGAGARVRGSRGSTHPRNRDDRHSKHAPSGSERQAARSWGAVEGEAELKDEQAGGEMAKGEKKGDAEAQGEANDAAVEPAEPEHISYADYLVQVAEKKLVLEDEGEVNLRKPNEGSKLDKKWANAQALRKDEEEVYFEGSGGKAKRERERKTKQVLDIDQRFVEHERGGGGRGGGRGRGGRGGGEYRGRGAPRGGGEYRGRGAPRGGGRGRGGAPAASGSHSAPINPLDKSAFPSLGA